MSKHPYIRKISFTGSTARGQKLMASASQTLKRITLELGGNDAGIVLDDVDPKKVAPGIFEGAFQNSGQVCLAIKRLYVHESVYDEVCNELVAIAKNTVVDDGSKQGTKLGPLQNKMQYEKVKAFLDDARKNGNVIAGGSPHNPMGVAAMTLAGGEYAIHGTNVPGSVGGFVSYGCIRMLNTDITDLYSRVSVGTTVVVTR